jgi:site-specific DNA recombinase
MAAIRATAADFTVGMSDTDDLADTVRVAFLGRVSTADMQDPTLSIPRQLDNCTRALDRAPFATRIVAYFYDVESGRKELDERGFGSAHEQFTIPVRRDGGVNDLLAGATADDRAFDAVICEAVDRVARVTYFGTKVEHDLERLGIPLWSAEEGVSEGKVKANMILLRRVNQGVAEWWVRKTLEQSWDGTCEHTRQGWNIGSPPYGYTGIKVPHPVPAKRAAGGRKTRLALDPVRADVVRRIFAMRVNERLGYRAIAARLNTDWERNPPPTCDEDGTPRGWTRSTVAGILANPKYTGYMVWNRRARNTRKGRPNPMSQWEWSPQVTHDAIIDRETWEAARAMGATREGSRSEAGLNLAHPQTKRSYRLRSFVVCAACGRRMQGKVRQGITYYHCRPYNHRPGAAFADHPPTVYVREESLVEAVGDFFATRVFGADRSALLVAEVGAHDEQAEQERAARTAGLRRALGEAAAGKARLIRTLEVNDDPDGVVFEGVHARLTELERERRALADELAALESADPAVGRDVALLDELPTVDGFDFSQAPEATLRTLFDAFRLVVRYDRTAHAAEITVELDDRTGDALRGVDGKVLPFPVAQVSSGPCLPMRAVPRTARVSARIDSLHRGAGRARRRP